jgi:aminopeptidase N
MKKVLFFLVPLTLLLSCTPKQYQAIILPETEYVNLDTLEVTAPRPDEYEAQDAVVAQELPKYNPSHKREHDLVHTKLDVRFDWEKEQVLGKATLTLKPWFYPTNKATLDAKGFEFHKVTYDGKSDMLPFEYDGKQIVVELGKTYNRNQEFKLYFEYTATPKASGGSSAISSDQGLYFINPRKEEPEKPQQIWTQGETESNSRWFPTVDKPNERCTQEIYITVEDRFKTLSNGVMVSSKKNADGSRTDYWKMDMPHAPYLFMMAIGEYAVVSDTWNGKPVDYYVEPKFEQHARKIFPHTPEMLGFFSEKLGVPYPWPKFSQVVVRDYVSGAMENTTAVIFGEFMQGTDRELVDNRTNDNIVAHEMFHHWFGDLVTCESWANLTLNEGFANYSEYLWLEHKYGKDEADFHRLQELQGYLQSAEGGVHPLIHFGYNDKEDMFDAHSYNKGGLILHMLRNYVGDEAFFASLQKYLQDNSFTDVEGHELRLAFEDVTGEDLNWFFNQWFFNQGHPQLNVEYDYDEATKQVIVSVEQTQDPKNNPAIFEMPVSIDVYAGGVKTRQKVRINQRKQTFSFPSDKDPDVIVFDAEGMLLAEKKEDKSLEEYIYQFEHGENFLTKIEALGELAESDDPAVKALFENALNDKFWLFRMFAVGSIEVNTTNAPRLAELAEKDPHSSVREAALSKLAETGDKNYAPVAARAIEKDPSIKVISAGLDALLQLDREAALTAAKNLEKENDESIILALASLYAEAGDPQRLTYFEEKFDKVGGFSQLTFLEQFGLLAAKAEPAMILRTAERFRQVATNMDKLVWLRFLATKSINDLHAATVQRIESESDAAKKTTMQDVDKQLVSIIEAIKAQETDERLTEPYSQFPEPGIKP